MSTRARIGILLEDNSILSSYVHWDGYPSYTGAILAKNYTTKEKVSELIDLGDLSTLKADRDWDNNQIAEGPLSYSERGDTEVEPILSKDDFAFVQQTQNCNGEFAYVFNTVTNQWSCYDLSAGEFVNLYQKEFANA